MVNQADDVKPLFPFLFADLDDSEANGLASDDWLDVGNNRPVRLHDPDLIWLVVQGSMDVFVVETQGGRAISPRRHLFRLDAGQALFGLDVHNHAEQIDLLAVGTNQARLARLPRERFEALLHDPVHGPRTMSLLDQWISSFSSSIARDVILRQYVPLESGATVSLDEGGMARPRRGVVWINVQAGAVRVVNRPELPVSTTDDLLPISDRVWISAVRPTRLTARRTSELIQEGFSWQHVANFHRMVLNCIVWNITRDQDAEVERLYKRDEQDRERMGEALKRLGAILEEPDASGFATDVATDDPLMAACQIIGRAMGVKIIPRPDPIDGRSEEQTLETIVRSSGLNMRQVTLRGKWWRTDSGPMLAYMNDDQRPVALIPASVRRYEIHDPTHKTRQTLTAARAREVAPTAYAFYQTLPNKVLTARDLLNFGLRTARGDLAMVLAMGVAGGLLATLIPLVTGRIFDTIVPTADRFQLVQFTLLLLAAALAMAIFQIVRSIAMLRVEIKLDAALQSAVWDRLLNLPAPFFREYTAGDLSIRAMGVNMIRRMISGTLVLSLLGGLFSIFNFLLLFFFDLQLALVAALLVALAFGVTFVAGSRKVRYQRTLADIEGGISGMVFQFILGIAKFRVAAVEGRAFNVWARRFTQQRELAFKAGNIENWLQVFTETYPILALMSIFAMTASSTNISTGEFLAFNAAFTQFLFAGLELSNALIYGLEVIPQYERMRPILATQPEVDETKSDPGELSGEIEVNRLLFRYKEDGPLILNDISFQIKPGDFVAIVGPSGSGKSTLFRLLLGFEKPESGGIFYDGQDLAGLDARSVRQQLGVVLQNGQLMTGDIYTNIVGVSNLSVDDAWEAAEMAGLRDDIEQMPMGMHTVVSEGGSTLSGGQRQRLLIARAIAQKPKILFFDEATSALDNRTQAIVSESLENLDATRIVIAHRLSTIVNADHILVLENGRLAQQGTYSELMQRSGVFRELARRQMV